MKDSMKKLLSLLLCVVLCAAMTLIATGCNDDEVSETTKEPIAASTGVPDETATEAPAPTATPKKTVSLTVTVKGSGGTKTFTYETDKSTVGAALLEEGLIEGEQGQYGLYVKVVDGETADWDTDGTYWAFYVNGEYAMTGVDSTPIEEGATYEFVRE